VKERILQLHAENPKWGYGKIAKVVGCDKSTVRYHLKPNYRHRQTVRKRKTLRSKKNLLVEEAGGKCFKCGYASCTAALEFHHLNPMSKSFEVTKRNLTISSLREEATKCILLCCRCHRELEHGVWQIGELVK
jgi:hypothetical protein